MATIASNALNFDDIVLNKQLAKVPTAKQVAIVKKRDNQCWELSR